MDYHKFKINVKSYSDEWIENLYFDYKMMLYKDKEAIKILYNEMKKRNLLK